MKPTQWITALVAATTLLTTAARADTAQVAVAANFTEAAKEIATAFQVKTGHRAVLSFGASGTIYNQIKAAAPFQVFLSADDERPKALADEGFALAQSRFTYAIGKLALWSKDANAIKGESTLRESAFSKISMANPAAAPYGVAAVQTLKALSLFEALQPKIVMGNSIAQAFQFIETGNAEVGFVALSQLNDAMGGSRWMVPQSLYSEIRQDAVLLKPGASNEAATAFMSFLRSPETRAIIERYGYAIDTRSGS